MNYDYSDMRAGIQPLASYARVKKSRGEDEDIQPATSRTWASTLEIIVWRMCLREF